MKRLKTLSVVIPSFNGINLLRKCLISLDKQSIKALQIIIVDNGSTDHTREIINKMFPHVQLIELGKNYGFAKACNVGITNVKADLVAILNNDAFPTQNWIKSILYAERAYPQYSVFTSKILSFSNPGIIDSVGDSVTQELKIKHRGEGEIDHGQYDKNEEIFLAPATAVVYKKSFFENVGVFDEDFGSYFEDVDLSFRGQLYGHKFLYVYQAVVKHIGKATSNKIYYVRGFFELRNSILVWVKNLPRSLIYNKIIQKKLIVFYSRLIFIDFRMGKLLLFLRIIIDITVNFSRSLQKRKEVQLRKIVSDGYIKSYLFV